MEKFKNFGKLMFLPRTFETDAVSATIAVGKSKENYSS